jgi:tRNA (adenine37-N6)-methyltransferase
MIVGAGSSHDSAGFAAFWSGMHSGTGTVLARRGDFSAEQIPAESVEKGARHPRGRTDWPKMGIFAQRSKDRPNRIGINICKLLFVKGLEIRASELDAVDDTPVLDVKPYLKGFAPRGEVCEPAWANELMAGYFCES